ncbi:hypothetical protein EG863_14090 [Enterococcus faecalis]|uniref:hypothetical protein n=1 Tax=Enterococcus faecalis TaxID=1351 RepID=UPI00032E9C63|nr:hypothetical protein [Enterococcus faecalis]EOJ52097.1 hypothetical protein WMI_02799 [Enterococcus faecalis EnGen0363]MEB5927525.1 hypothetical protein [Enterococcus faecalis]RXF26304.1 hypothetical protein EG863_14090 [Enterococcus faecalis]
MKLRQIQKKYQFNQNTFYKWLNETGLIRKDTSGYVVGPNAILGMKTITSNYINENGEKTTMVAIEDSQVKCLVDMYLSSGYDKIFSKSKDLKKLTLSEHEISLIIDLLIKEMKQIIDNKSSGAFGILNMTNEDLIMGTLREIHENQNSSDAYAAEAFSSMLDIEYIYLLIKKLR